ncbi:hypothetical protein WA026_001737 [Henosepilachna vigintioctopunctata]|uniref:Uncharacterized protein n=1 Tax=Henosepilachna vigintioctopunctata TaxID=420089 RepID=A0AAW1UR75_9CUCU
MNQRTIFISYSFENPELICLTWKSEKGVLSQWNDECCPRSKIKLDPELKLEKCDPATKCVELDPSNQCHPSLRNTLNKPIWECRVPDPNGSCGGTNRELDPRCMPIIGGYGHPHVVMFDDFSYYVKIEFSEMY